MDHMEEVAIRLKGLRDALDLSTLEIANATGITENTYIEYESGKADIPVSFLHRLSHEYGVELMALMFGGEPKMTSYYVTRNGRGEKVERTKAYSYQTLAAGFANRVLDPFLVTVEPNIEEHKSNSHEGQEFNYVLEGKMEMVIGRNKIILNAGDSIMFDGRVPHKMRALDEKPVKFMAIIA